MGAIGSLDSSAEEYVKVRAIFYVEFFHVRCSNMAKWIHESYCV